MAWFSAQDLDKISEALSVSFADELVASKQAGIFTAGKQQGKLWVLSDAVRLHLKEQTDVKAANNGTFFANHFGDLLYKNNVYYIDSTKPKSMYKGYRAFHFDWNPDWVLNGQNLLRRLFVKQPGNPEVDRPVQRFVNTETFTSRNCSSACWTSA
jgi:hypothetical protein